MTTLKLIGFFLMLCGASLSWLPFTSAAPTSRCDDYSYSDTQSLQSRLFAAVKKEDIKEVESLIVSGVSCDIYDENDWSLLMYAAKGGNINLVRLLVKCGASIDPAIPGKFSAILAACKYEKYEVLKYLIEEGATVSVSGVECHDCLDLIVSGREAKGLNTLVDLGADINRKNCNGFTPLMSSSWFTTQAILNLGADIDAVDAAGNTAIMYSIIEGNDIKFHILLKNKPNLSIVNSSGESAYELALKFDRRNMLKALKR